MAEETRALRSRIHLAEAAQRQAHGMEMDYEEVIHLLEAEISELKAQLADYSDQNKVSKQPSLVTMVSLPLSCILFSFSFHLHI